MTAGTIGARGSSERAGDGSREHAAGVEVGPGAPADWADDRRLARMLAAAVAAVASLYLPLVFRRNVNWDEFRYLSVVYDFERNALAAPLQSVHVHLFGWLPTIGRNEVDQVIAARSVYYLLLLASCWLVYLISRRFFPGTIALLVVLCYFSYSEIIAHGTSFRFDGLCAFLLLGALAVLLRAPPSAKFVLLAGALTATALLVSLKSLFYLPTLVLVAALVPAGARWRERLGRSGVFLAAAAAAFIVLLALHKASLTVPAVTPPTELAARAGSKVIRLDSLFPGRQIFFRSVAGNAVVWYLLLRGMLALLGGVRRRERTRESLLLLALLLPLGSLAVYRNAFPYYYVFLMPPVLVVCGAGIAEMQERLRRGPGRASPALLAMTAAGVLLTFGMHYSRYTRDETRDQRRVLDAVHEMFPEEVAYIDRNSMVSSFPKVGFFMSTWGFEDYHRAGKPVFPRLLRESEPRFLLANHPALELTSATGREERGPGGYRLLPEDLQALRDNFVPHWGPIYVAGKRLPLAAGGTAEFEVLIPDVYTVESSAAVMLDGVARRPGQQVRLTRGRHAIRSLAGEQTVTLRLEVAGDHPTGSPPAGRLYTGL